MVVWSHELGEVEKECTSHNFSLFAIFLPNIIKIGGIWRRSDKNKFAQFFWDTVYMLRRSQYACSLQVTAATCQAV